MKKTVTIIGVIIIVVLGIIILPSPRFARSSVQSNQTLTTSSSSSIEEGDFEIDTVSWHGKSCYDRTKRLDFFVVTPDVFVLVRPDGQDGKTVPVYPKNWKKGSHLELPEFNLLEAQVAPGQSISNATVHWVISDRR